MNDMLHKSPLRSVCKISKKGSGGRQSSWVDEGEIGKESQLPSAAN